MASKSVKQLRSILKKLESSVGENLKKQALEPVADFLLETIKKRIRLGYQVPGSLQDKSKFTPLSDAYVEWRKKQQAGVKSLTRRAKNARKRGDYGKAKTLSNQAKKIQLSPFFSPSRSNLHLSGKMINSLRASVQSSTVSNGIIEIKPTGQHHRGVSNVDLAGWHNDGISGKLPARPFLFISRLEFKQAVRFYRKTFGDLLRKRKVI
jgi:hypothetical protein